MSQSKKFKEADQTLDTYIYDYLMKRQMYETAKIFHDEGNVAPNVDFDAPGGFLLEWWSVFWELLFARQGLPHSEAALAYVKSQQIKAEEMRKQEMMKFVSQRLAQQRQQGGDQTRVFNGSVLHPINNVPLVRPNQVTSNTMAQRPAQQQQRGDQTRVFNGSVLRPINNGPLVRPNQAQRSAQQQQHGDQTRVLNGSVLHPINNDFLARQNQARDQLHTELLQKYNFLSSQGQFSPRQQLMLQTQQNLVTPSISGFDRKRPRMLLNDQNMVLGKDGPSNSLGDSIPNIVIPAPAGYTPQGLDMFLEDLISRHGSRQKQKLGSSPGVANSTGTANTTGPSSGSPSTPSSWIQNDLRSLASTQDQLADADHLNGDETLGDNFESFSSLPGTDHKRRVGKGFSFKEIQYGVASSRSVYCCHFSSDGKLLVTGCHDKKAYLWCTESSNLKSTFEEHTLRITDVRFCPTMSRVATSSVDKTVKVWDVNNPAGHSLWTFSGHISAVTSLEFHPSKNDLIFSSDTKDIRCWSIENGICVGVFKGGATQLRFQPGLRKLLAAAVDDLVLILDEETMGSKLKLQGHKNLVHSVCWDSSGNYLASVSDELVRIWAIGTDNDAKCIRELKAASAGTEKKFKTCVFHPNFHVLVIACNETLMLWDYLGKKFRTVQAHDMLVSDLAVSDVTGLVASVSHDGDFRIWK